MAGPVRTRPVTDEQIVAAYDRTKNAYAAAAELGIGQATIYRVLARLGVPRVGLALHRQKAKRFTPAEVLRIVRAYAEGAGIPALVGRFGGSEHTVRKALLGQGVTLRKVSQRPRRAGEIERIIRLRLVDGLSQAQVAAAVGRSQGDVSRVLLAAGIGKGGLCCRDCGSPNVGVVAKGMPKGKRG